MQAASAQIGGKNGDVSQQLVATMTDEVLATWIAGALVLGTVAPSVGKAGDQKLGFVFIILAIILQVWAMYSFYVDSTHRHTVLFGILVLLLFAYVYAITFL